MQRSRCRGRYVSPPVRDRLQETTEVQIDVLDRYVLKRRVDQKLIAHQLHKAQEHPDVQIIFGDGAFGLALDRLVVG